MIWIFKPNLSCHCSQTIMFQLSNTLQQFTRLVRLPLVNSTYHIHFIKVQPIRDCKKINITKLGQVKYSFFIHGLIIDLKWIWYWFFAWRRKWKNQEKNVTQHFGTRSDWQLFTMGFQGVLMVWEVWSQTTYHCGNHAKMFILLN